MSTECVCRFRRAMQMTLVGGQLPTADLLHSPAASRRSSLPSRSSRSPSGAGASVNGPGGGGLGAGDRGGGGERERGGGGLLPTPVPAAVPALGTSNAPVMATVPGGKPPKIVTH